MHMEKYEYNKIWFEWNEREKGRQRNKEEWKKKKNEKHMSF
jgi:hypothetical protein